MDSPQHIQGPGLVMDGIKSRDIIKTILQLSTIFERGGIQVNKFQVIELLMKGLTPGSFDATVDDSQWLGTDAIKSGLADGSILLVDARTAERFRGESEPIDPVAGHIPGAINLPLQRNLNADGTFRSAAELRRLYRTAIGAHNPSQVAAMCGSGVTACHNLLAMELAGLTGGRLYAGSWSEWIRDPGRPVATGS